MKKISQTMTYKPLRLYLLKAIKQFVADNPHQITLASVVRSPKGGQYLAVLVAGYCFELSEKFRLCDIEKEAK